MTDEITLTLPREKPYYGIAHLVLGGLAVRLDLTFESLEDLQLALEGLLDRATPEGELTVSVRVQDDAVRARVGPFAQEELGSALDEDAERVTLGRVLDTVVDDVAVGEHEGHRWVELTKAVRQERAGGT